MPRRVLIADDNEAIRNTLRAYLERRADVEICAQTADGREAVDAALALKPDVAILDVRMPKLNGIEVASLLKKNLPATKTILFTMYGDLIGKNIAAASGVDIVLNKPDGLTSLADAVGSLLGAPVQKPGDIPIKIKKVTAD